MSMIWLTARSQFLQRRRDALCLWTECDKKEGMRNRVGSREDQRRQKCSTALKMSGLVRQSAARSVTDRSASSGTIPGELPSVQRSALNASRPAARRTANGYADFRSPPRALHRKSCVTRFRNSENNEYVPWAFCSDSSCGAAVYWRVLHSRRKRAKVTQPSIILHKTSGYTKNSIQRGTCPIIQGLAVATTRTATRLKSSTLTETSTPSVEKTGSTFSFRPRRWNAIGIIPMDEITCAHRRPIPCSRRIPYTASHWEAPHDAPSGASQSRVPRTKRHGLSGDFASKEHAATIPSIGL
jgi:hypothetical protein